VGVFDVPGLEVGDTTAVDGVFDSVDRAGLVLVAAVLVDVATGVGWGVIGGG
jgi:hypothetical protein